MIAARVRLHHARVHRKPFALDQTGRHAGCDDTFKEVAKNVALPEPVEPVLRERRMMWDFVVEIEPAEPSVRQMKVNFLGQLALRAQAVSVPDNQHPDHQFRIDRWPAYLAVVRIELLMHIGERRRHEYIDASEQVVLGDTVVESKFIE